MSEEEIIKKMDKDLRFIENNYIEDNMTSIRVDIQLIKDFRKLLDLYNKEKEKNKLLKTYKGNLPENVKLICLCKDDFERNISTDYISKDKIREKIKELKKEIEEKQEHGTDFTLMFEHEIDTNAIITALEELLEENKSNENNI